MKNQKLVNFFPASNEKENLVAYYQVFIHSFIQGLPLKH